VPVVKHDGSRSFRANGDSGRHIAGGGGVAEQDMTKSLTRQTFGAARNWTSTESKPMPRIFARVGRDAWCDLVIVAEQMENPSLQTIETLDRRKNL
jgi:hypothetical protein